MAENKEKYKEWNYCFAEWKAEITIDDRRVTSCSACEGQKQKRTPLCPPVGLSCSKCGDSDVASLMANVMDIFVSFPCCGVFCWLLRYPRAHRANLPLRSTVPEVTGSSPYIRGRHSLHKMNGFLHRCIPVHTGQIFHPKIQALCSEIHPRTHGADTKSSKEASEAAEQLLPPQNSMTESVCVIFLERVFADNAFWLFSMVFAKKEMPAAPLSQFFPDYRILFRLHSSRVLHSSNELSFPVQ